MVIYLFYEHIVREYKALLGLKEVLERRGNRVFMYSIIFETNAFAAKAKVFPPDVIYMPWFYTEIEEKAIYPLICQNANLKVIDFHHEELTSPGREDYFIPKTVYAKRGIFHLAWGGYFKDFLVKNGVPEERVFVTGNIRSDLIVQSSISRNKLAEEFQLDPGKKWILFAETRGFWSQRYKKSERKLLLKKVSASVIEEGCREDRDCLERFMQDLESIGDDFKEKYEFIYRPHPGTHAEQAFPNWVKVISSRSISDWIGNSDIFLSRGSTSIFEADAADIPCVLYENYPTPSNKMITGLDKYPQISSLNDITPMLLEELKANKKNVFQEYIGMVDGKVTERVADIIEMINKPEFDIENKQMVCSISKPTFLYSLKRIIYDIVVRFMVKTRLIELFKYPHSAYIMLKDIPYYYKNKWKDEN